MAKGEIFGVEFGTESQRPGELAKDQSEHLDHAIQNKGQCRESPGINQNPGFWKRQRESSKTSASFRHFYS